MRLFRSYFFAGLISLSAFSIGKHGDMIGSGGFGFTMGPTLVLLSPELEYVYREDLMFGGLVQMCFGEATLFTMTGKARWTIKYHPKIHPTFEGGLGLAVGSNRFDSALGVHILLGVGVEYRLSSDTSIGTMLRMNFAPPLDSVFVSWPLIIGRFRL